MAEVDLHLHTTHSDGRRSPAQLVRLCAERGLRVISVSDHDSTEGIPEALEAAKGFGGMQVIPGVELGTDIPGGEIHILGYFVPYEDPGLQETLSRFRDGREWRAREMVKKLNRLGIGITWERVAEISGGGAVGRPHIAQAMVEGGYVRYPRDAFAEYLGRDGKAYVERPKMTPAEAVEMLVASGALPVMAHPTYSDVRATRGDVGELRKTLARLKEVGMVGMEVYYGDYPPAQVRVLKRLADEMGLVPCGGSDFHASGNPGEPEPGTVGPPMESVSALTALHGQRAAAGPPRRALAN